jgi:hypothetical protein
VLTVETARKEKKTQSRNRSGDKTKEINKTNCVG